MPSKKTIRQPLISRLRGRGGGAGDDLPIASSYEPKGHLVNSDRSSVVSEETHIRGHISSPGSVYINGRLDGDIRAEKIVIGRHGVVSGNCRSRGMSIAGRVCGDLLCEQLQVFGTGVIDGNIQCVQMDVSAGAELNAGTHVSGIEELPDVLLISEQGQGIA